MRRPVLYLLVVAAVLLGVAGSRSCGPRSAGSTSGCCPAGTPSRTVAERIATEFPGGGLDPVVVLVEGATPAGLETYRMGLTRLPGVTGASVYAAHPDAAVLTVTYPGEPSTDEARPGGAGGAGGPAATRRHGGGHRALPRPTSTSSTACAGG
jgi:RND superfamily putative drug exporter